MTRSAYVGGLFGIAAAALAAGLLRSTAAESGEGKGLFNEKVIGQVRNLILRHYVEPSEDLDKKLYYGALSGMADALDRHSQFLTPDEREELEIDVQGKFGGLGIVIEKPLGKDGPIVVVTPFLGTPASKAGIQPGDRIIEIEGKPTVGMELAEAVDRLRGTPGTKVRVKVQRGVERLSRSLNAGRLLQGCRLVSLAGEPVGDRKESEIFELLKAKRGQGVEVVVVPEVLAEPEELVIERGEIHVPSVEFSRIVDRKAMIGYVHLSRFHEDSPAALKKAIEDLRAKGMRALVLDLRGNPGGLLAAAVQASELFLKSGVIVSTRGRGDPDGRSPETVFRANSRNAYTREELPLAVLIDGYTASAAEILAAAIRDNRRGVVVGSRSFGKGSVQKPFDVNLGRDPATGKPLVGALKLTVEKYYTPSGVCIQREEGKDSWGVEPDVVVEVSDGEMIDIRRQWEKDKLAEQRGETVDDSAAGRVRDAPLERALEILRAVLVLAPSAEMRAAAD